MSARYIEYGHGKVLGRPCIEAWVFNPALGADIIPRLLDAKVKGMGCLDLNIGGLEEVDAALCAQSWRCRIE